MSAGPDNVDTVHNHGAVAATHPLTRLLEEP